MFKENIAGRCARAAGFQQGDPIGAARQLHWSHWTRPGFEQEQ